jgi:hypothetical protein
MSKRQLILTVGIVAVIIMSSSISYGAEKENFGSKIKNFWKNLLSYPARVTEESASVVADTLKSGVGVVTNEIKRVGEVTTGDFAKTKELIIEPITGTAETAVHAAEGVIGIPSEAAKEKTETQSTKTE